MIPSLCTPEVVARDEQARRAAVVADTPRPCLMADPDGYFDHLTRCEWCRAAHEEREQARRDLERAR